MRNQTKIVENTNVFMSGKCLNTKITFRSYSKGRIGRIEVFSSHYRADTTYSKPTLITRLKNALNET